MVLALVLVVVVSVASVVILRRLNRADADATEYIAQLKQMREKQREGSEQLAAAVEVANEHMASWDAKVTTAMARLSERVGTPAETGASRVRPTGPPARPTSPVGHESLSASGSRGLRAAPIEILAEAGGVPEDYSAAQFHTSMQTVQRAAASRYPPLFPRIPEFPVYFFVPARGRPGGDMSASSLVATEDHEAALILGMSIVARSPQTTVDRRVVVPSSDAQEWEGLRGHLATFCRERRNPLTKALLDHDSTRARFDLRFPYDEHEQVIVLNGKEYRITRPANAYSQDEPEDLALVARFPNPWWPEAKALVIAGTKAYGTWGAAEFLRSNWVDIMNAVGGHGPIEERDFACVLRVRVRYGIGSESDAEVPDYPRVRILGHRELSSAMIEAGEGTSTGIEAGDRTLEGTEAHESASDRAETGEAVVRKLVPREVAFAEIKVVEPTLDAA